MERLTCKYELETVLRDMCTFDRESDTEPDDCMSCEGVCSEFSGQGCDNCPIQKGFDRLAQYEDTGLEPEEILSGLELANIAAALMKLKEYQKAEKVGRMAKLPCGVGDIIYVIRGKVDKRRIYKEMIERITLKKDDVVMIHSFQMDSKKFNWVDTELEYLKTVSFNKFEAAEAKLKELEGEHERKENS